MLVDSDVGYDDADLQPWVDDMGAYTQVDTTVTGGPGAPYDVTLRMGYMFDTPNTADDVPGYLGLMLLGHGADSRSPALAGSGIPRAVEIHAFRIWSGGVLDPRDDLDRYHLMRGLSDEHQTIDPPTTRADDWRYLISAGPFENLATDSTMLLQLAFVCGEVIEITDENGVTRLVPDLTNPIQAQRVFDGYVDVGSGDVVHWVAGHPPPAPNARVTPGNGTALVEWDDFPEGVHDPITGELDFAGYRLERAGPMPANEFPPESAWHVVAEWDTSEVAEIDTGNPGIGRYAWTDRGLRNFRSYWYRVGRAVLSGIPDARGAARGLGPGARGRADPAEPVARGHPPRLIRPLPRRAAGGHDSHLRNRRKARGHAGTPRGRVGADGEWDLLLASVDPRRPGQHGKARRSSLIGIRVAPYQRASVGPGLLIARARTPVIGDVPSSGSRPRPRS
jgi:hypothetical protein